MLCVARKHRARLNDEQRALVASDGWVIANALVKHIEPGHREDCRQNILERICQAVSRFNPELASFKTFAFQVGRGARSDYFRSVDTYSKTERKRMRKGEEIERTISSWEELVNDRQEIDIEWQSESDDVVESVYAQEMIEIFEKSDVNPRDRLVLLLLHCDDMTMREVGELMGITESRISQMNTRGINVALRKMRSHHVKE